MSQRRPVTSWARPMEISESFVISSACGSPGYYQHVLELSHWNKIGIHWDSDRKREDKVSYSLLKQPIGDCKNGIIIIIIILCLKSKLFPHRCFFFFTRLSHFFPLSVFQAFCCCIFAPCLEYDVRSLFTSLNHFPLLAISRGHQYYQSRSAICSCPWKRCRCHSLHEMLKWFTVALW